MKQCQDEQQVFCSKKSFNRPPWALNYVPSQIGPAATNLDEIIAECASNFP